MLEPNQEAKQQEAPQSAETADCALSEATAPASEQEPKQTQEEMLAAYRLQQQRMRCTGCGEGEEFF